MTAFASPTDEANASGESRVASLLARMMTVKAHGAETDAGPSAVASEAARALSNLAVNADNQIAIAKAGYSL